MQRVIIIGAGPAGLTAAYKLIKERKNEYEIIILESSKQVGGISKTINFESNYMDLGGHRFFTKNKEIFDIWTEFLDLQGYPAYDDKVLNREEKYFPNGKDPEKKDDIFLIRNRVSRIYYLKKFFDYPVTLKYETLKNMGLKKTIQAGFSYLKTIFIKKEETNLENFYCNRFGFKLYKMFFYEYTKKLWGTEPREIDASWGLQRVKGLSIAKVLKKGFCNFFHLNNHEIETSLIEKFYYPKYGPGEFYERMATYLEKNGVKIYFNHEVIQINKNASNLKSVVCQVDKERKIIKGDIFISSMPLKDLILSMNNVPNKVSKIAKGLPYRDFITIGLLVKKLKIHNETKIKTINNIPPDCWIYVQEKNIKLGRIQIFNNWSPYLVQNLEDTVWLGLEYFCQENDDFWNKSDLEIQEFAVSELIKMDIINKDDILKFHVERVKKAYPAYFGTYKDIKKAINYVSKLTNLYCIGRNGQHRYNNMDHSMLTGLKAAECILENKNLKEELFNINTEAEYHEVQSEKINKKN